jgi:flagellin-like protein
MRRQYYNKKAVSPVIATVLMILVTMVGMTLLFTFVSSYAENYKAGVGSSVMESLTFEDIYLSPNMYPGSYNNQVTLSVYNVGKVDMKINSLYVDGMRLQVNNFDLSQPIKVGSHVSITASVPTTFIPNWVSGVPYTFRIVTQSGSKFDVTYTAPMK